MYWKDVSGSAAVLGLLMAGICMSAVATPGVAAAASYVDTVSANPTSLSCFFVGSGGEECRGFAAFAGGPRTLNVGDMLTETVSYTSPVMVPASQSFSYLFVALPDENYAPGQGAHPGPDFATYDSTATGYVGAPPNVTGPYSAGYLDEYIAVYGIAGPNGGFSATGITSTFDILAADPTPIDGVGFGWTIGIPEPRTWALALVGVVLLGGILRIRRQPCAEIA